MTYSEWINWAALVAYLLANLADVVTTEAVLRSGRGREGNPVVAWLMERIGRGWIVVKLAVAGAAGWYLVSIGAAPWLLIPAALIGGAAWRNAHV